MESGGAMYLLTDHLKGFFDVPRCCLEGIGIDGEGGAENNERSTIGWAGDGLFNG